MSTPLPEDATAQYRADGSCAWCGKPVQDGARALHPRYCTCRPAAAAATPPPTARPALSDTFVPGQQYDPDGHCRGCRKFVQDGARAMHPRYCTADPPPPLVSLRKAGVPPAPATAGSSSEPASALARESPVKRVQLGAMYASVQFGNEPTAKAVNAAMDLMGRDLAALLAPGEVVLLTIACEVARGAKTPPGLVLVTDRRVLLGWSTGLWPSVTHHDEVALGEALSVTRNLVKVDFLHGWRSHMTFSNGRTLRFSIYDTSTGSLGFAAEGIASGWITVELAP